jgi:hypothetical protein
LPHISDSFVFDSTCGSISQEFNVIQRDKVIIFLFRKSIHVGEMGRPYAYHLRIIWRNFYLCNFCKSFLYQFFSFGSVTCKIKEGMHIECNPFLVMRWVTPSYFLHFLTLVFELYYDKFLCVMLLSFSKFM